METARAFAMGEANRGKEMKVFDWDKAARLLKDRQPNSAQAGLSSDMEWTAGEIWRDGVPVKEEYSCMFLASTWATPVIAIDFEEIPCYLMDSQTNFDSGTVWPESALNIIGVAEAVTVED